MESSFLFVLEVTGTLLAMCGTFFWDGGTGVLVLLGGGVDVLKELLGIPAKKESGNTGKLELFTLFLFSFSSIALFHSYW